MSMLLSARDDGADWFAWDRPCDDGADWCAWDRSRDDGADWKPTLDAGSGMLVAGMPIVRPTHFF